MKTPLQITFRDIEHSDALETHIARGREAGDLLRAHHVLRVVVEMPHQHKHQGKFFNVRIDIGVPGSEIVVNRDRARRCVCRAARRPSMRQAPA